MATQPPRKAGRPRKKPEGAASLSELKELSEKSLQEYGKSERTRTAYATYVARGKEFLDYIVGQRREAQAKGGKQPDDIDTNLLAKAFDKPPNGPNQLSAKALEFFLVEKCFQQNCGRSTAERIHAAFCDYWDNMSVCCSC
jgi:hypothetical protein